MLKEESRMSYRRLSLQYYVLAVTILACQCLLFAHATGEEPEPEARAPGSKGRVRAKEWYLTKIKAGKVELPFDCVTLLVGVVSVYFLYKGLTSSDAKPTCTASHILIPNHEDTTEAKMEEFKKKIGDDKDAFAKCAMENSTCPSKNKGGMLGTFPRGAMVPAFDKCCFDPATPLHTTVGPVHTHFGYHLIFIHDRTMPKK